MEPITSVIHRLMGEGKVHEADTVLSEYGQYMRNAAIEECAEVARGVAVKLVYAGCMSHAQIADEVNKEIQKLKETS